ncbi:hypothetical protein [uncultured Campylobacter sp.]|nr:hypothetical protein [uncultured Campylobacter sp.]
MGTVMLGGCAKFKGFGAVNLKTWENFKFLGAQNFDYGILKF